MQIAANVMVRFVCMQLERFNIRALNVEILTRVKFNDTSVQLAYYAMCIMDEFFYTVLAFCYTVLIHTQC